MDPPEGKVPAGGGERMPTGEALVAALEARLAAALGSPVTVDGLVRSSGGASRETWAFDAVADGAARPLILRRCAPDARSASMELEAAASSAAGERGVPVPGVVLAADDAADLGGPSLVAERIEGETVARRIFRLLDGPTSLSRADVARQCATALARLHRVEAGDVDGLTPEEDPVEARRRTIDELGVVSPAFELGLRWLDSHRPAPGRSSMVHGDYRVGNLIVGADGLRAVLDWELVHAGDPLEDLGWYCSRAWRFGEDHLEAGGLASIGEFVTAYEAEAGASVERAALEWWVTMADLNWGVICAIQAERHLSGAQPSVELAAIGRRIPEAEWDVMECLRRTGWPR